MNRVVGRPKGNIFPEETGDTATGKPLKRFYPFLFFNTGLKSGINVIL